MTPRIRSLCTVFLGLFAFWTTASATDQINYDDWRDFADRVERVIHYDTAPDQTLERLRTEVAGWRETFLLAQQDRSLRISTLERQIEALGPESSGDPSDSETESTEEQAVAEVESLEGAAEESSWIDARRTELQERLEALEQPNIRAGEAFAHADGLVRELDALLRQRKADVVLARGPTLLNPLTWQEPLREIKRIALLVPTETIEKIRDIEERKVTIQNLPLVVLLVLVGGILVLRGRVWTGALRHAARRSGPPVISYPLQTIVLAIEIALPWFGLVALLSAATQSNLFGNTGDALLQAIRSFGLFAIIGLAFVDRLLPTEEDDPTFVPLAARDAARARRIGFWMVWTIAFARAMSTFLGGIEVAENTIHFLIFPFFVVLGYLLYRFSRLFRVERTSEDDEDASFSLKLLSIVARLGMLIGLFAPLAAAAGFFGLASATLNPAYYTIFSLGLAAFFNEWLADLYTAMTRRSPDQSDLAPTLIGIGVYAALIPVLALIWGARVADLTEVWAQLREGFSLGGVKVSPSDILTFLVVFALAYGLTRLLQAALKVSILPKTKLDIGSRTAIVSGIGYIGIFLAAFLAIQSTGLDLSSLAIVAGALSVGIGFGLQTIVSNFVSGIILLIERPISEGDWIDVGGQQGYVRAISVRSTRIETFDRTDVIVPNSDLISGTVTNWTRGNLIGRLIIPVGVAYGTDPQRVTRILREIAEDHPLVLLSPAPSILFMGFGADALEFQIRAILRDVNFSLSARSEINHEIAKRFRKENIEIPFAQRDLWLRNPEVLAQGQRFAETGRHFVEYPEEPIKSDRVADEVPDLDQDGPGEADQR